MITLNKITFKNFKIFGDDSYTINFSSSNLTLLDGPNGYGKTSVFDGIELALTGNIERLISLESRQNPSDIVVAHNGSNNIEIVIELTDDSDAIKTFKRSLRNPIPNNLKKISKFVEIWELSELIDSKYITCSQSRLDDYFNSKNFKRDFLLFHYVPQEETSRFLKSNNESQRAEELAKLFGNTIEADKKLNHLQYILTRIKLKNKFVLERIDDIKRTYSLDDKSSDDSLLEAEYTVLFPWLENSPYWDTRNIEEFSKQRLNNALNEVASIRNFINNRKFYLRNLQFEKSINQKETIDLYLKYYRFTEHYDSIVRQNKINQKISKLYDAIYSRKLENIYKIPFLEEAFDALEVKYLNEFLIELSSILKMERDTNGINFVLTEIIKNHSSLSDSLPHINNESNCMLCGHDYKSHDNLSKAILKHGDALRSNISGNEKLLIEARDNFQSKYISNLQFLCESYLKLNNNVSQGQLLELAKANNIIDRFEKLRLWLISENIDHDDLLSNTLNSHTESNYYTLCERIRLAIGKSSDSYNEANQDNIFDRIYRDYFQNNSRLIRNITHDALDSKENYIKSKYFSSQKEIIEELRSLSKHNSLLELAKNDVESICTTINKKIKQYRKKLLADIEIPFYIYSGKILQSHQAGLGQGILIKDLPEMMNLKMLD